MYPGLDTIQLKGKLRITVKRHHDEDSKLITQQRVLDTLIRVVEKRHLPLYFAYETMRRLLARGRWLYSYRHQIIELIWLLQEARDPRLNNHIEALCKEINYVKPL